MRAEWVARMALVYLVAALLVGGWAEARIDSWAPTPPTVVQP